MKLYTTIVAALFGLLMMATTGVASADVVVVHPQNGLPVLVQEAVAPAQFTTVEYYRPWACANRHFRRHHWWLCR